MVHFQSFVLVKRDVKLGEWVGAGGSMKLQGTLEIYPTTFRFSPLLLRFIQQLMGFFRYFWDLSNNF